MNPILYFLPTPKQAIEPADLKAAGLSYAHEDGVGVHSRRTTSGPEGQVGLIFALGTDLRTQDLAYKPEEQIWRRIPGGDAWAGIWKDRKPGPLDLVRKRVYGNQTVRLLDGNEWIVPRCYAFRARPDRTDSLPRVFDLDENGELVGKIHPDYDALFDKGMRSYLHYIGALKESDAMTVAEVTDNAVDALAVNYRLGRTEAIALLGLLGTDEIWLVMRAMIDADEIDHWIIQQKAAEHPTEPASASSTSSGGTDDSRSTSSPSPSGTGTSKTAKKPRSESKRTS